MKLNKLYIILIIFNINLINCKKIYNNNEIKIIDPFNYNQRNNFIFKNIIDNTLLEEQFGKDNLNNCFHGLQFLLNWQFESGRLYSNISDSDPEIKNYSWWGCMNYYFSVIPYFSAEKLGLVPPIKVELKFKNNSHLFCQKYEECDKDMIEIWDNYFGAIAKIKNGKNETHYNGNDLLKLMWKGHQIGVIKGSQAFEKIHETTLSEPEKKLSYGWLTFVEMLLTLNLNTNKTNIFSLQKSLPHRLLTENDNFPPSINDFNYDQKTFTTMIFSLYYISFHKPIYDFSIYLLQLISSNDNCRLLINNNINSFLNYPLSSIIIVLIKILTNTC